MESLAKDLEFTKGTVENQNAPDTRIYNRRDRRVQLRWTGTDATETLLAWRCVWEG
jgi:hypothetical protein